MKVVAFRGSDILNSYGAKYDQEFFEALWKKNLEDREEIDEVVYLDHSEIANNVGAKINGADAVIGMWLRDDSINEELIAAAPTVKYISTGAHGYGRYDAELLKKHGITLTNTIYGDATIAQFAMGLLLDVCHNIGAHSEYYKHEKWEKNIKGKHVVTPQVELYKKTIGIVGLGNIGYKVAKMAQGFDMNVISYSRSKKVGPEYDFIEQVSMDELLERSDFISIHCPLTAETTNLIDKEAIEKMKDGVIIINTARGAIIDEDALYDALKSGKVQGAGLDVLVGEPLQKPSKIMECENAKVTEHIAWLTIESRIRSIEMLCQNLVNWINGNPTSVINK